MNKTLLLKNQAAKPNILLKISVYESGKNGDFIKFFILKSLQAQTKFRFRFQVFYV